MALIHDAYLFSPRLFLKAMVPFATAIGQDAGRGYRLLRENAIRSFDHNSKVRLLADRYGSWDRPSIAQHFPEQIAEDASDITFWLILSLYEHLGLPSDDEAVSLGHYWRECCEVLQILGWDEAEARLLIHGHRFETLAQACMDNTDALLALDEVSDIWTKFRPMSTSSSTGWLDQGDVEMLSQKLDLERIGSSAAGARLHDDKHQNVLRRAKTTLEWACRHSCGLCFIMSG